MRRDWRVWIPISCGCRLVPPMQCPRLVPPMSKNHGVSQMQRRPPWSPCRPPWYVQNVPSLANWTAWNVSFFTFILIASSSFEFRLCWKLFLDLWVWFQVPLKRRRSWSAAAASNQAKARRDYWVICLERKFLLLYLYFVSVCICVARCEWLFGHKSCRCSQWNWAICLQIMICEASGLLTAPTTPPSATPNIAPCWSSIKEIQSWKKRNTSERSAKYYFELITQIRHNTVTTANITLDWWSTRKHRIFKPEKKTMPKAQLKEIHLPVLKNPCNK